MKGHGAASSPDANHRLPMSCTTFTQRKGAQVAITNRIESDPGAVRRVRFVCLRRDGLRVPEDWHGSAQGSGGACHY